MDFKNFILPLAGLSAVLGGCASSPETNETADAAGALTATPIGSYRTGVFDESAAEIVDFHPATGQLFVVNGNDDAIDILDISDPSGPKKVGAISLEAEGKGVQSVAVHGDVLAAAVSSAESKQAPGKVVLMSVDGTILGSVTVGALPDMVTFTPNGKFILVANEGEPSDDYASDPLGSISIIEVPSDSATFSSAPVTTLDFSAFNGPIQGIHQGHPERSNAENFEPEYIAVSEDSKTAVAVLQESNAIAIVDLEMMEIVGVKGLGYKDHSKVDLDPSNKDDAIQFRTGPVLGMYQPDAIVAVTGKDGQTYFLTANEGDARDYDAWSEETRVKDLELDSVAFPNAEELQESENFGRLKTTTAMGDTDGDGDHDVIYAYGARSFSVWDADGNLVWDSGDQFEKVTAERLPGNFNSTNDENDSFDNRSDDKGPEPEGIAVGRIGKNTYAFIGLERVGGFMIYDITDPRSPAFVDYVTTRDFGGDPEKDTAGDLAPEGLLFIAANDSPNGKPLLVVAHEVSGSTTIFELTR